MFIQPEELKSNRGATLVEVVVALLILTVGMVPALYSAQSSLSIATTIRDNMIAANLAQEGIEVAHSIRESNWFNGRPYNTGLTDGNYQTEWNTPLTAYADTYLLFDSSSGRYNYTVGTASAFKRKITIINQSFAHIIVQSSVQWYDRGTLRTVMVEDHLFNWK